MDRLRSRVLQFGRNRQGSIAIIAAAAGAIIVPCAAMGIDVGSVFLEGRRMQGIADLSAIAAARDLANGPIAAQATLEANPHHDALSLVVTTGTYSPDPTLAPGDRFVPGASPATAVRVQVHGSTPVYFMHLINGRDSIDLTRSATAARAEVASFTLGSRLASLQGGLANTLLSQLTGSQVSLSVADYNALANAQVDLFDYVQALRTSAHLETASFDKTLAANITLPQALTALSQALAGEGQTQAAAACKTLALAATVTKPLQLSKLIDLGPYAHQDHVAGASDTSVKLTAMETAEALLFLANGNRQVELDLTANVPSLTSVKAWLAIGERPNNAPWASVSQDGSVIIRTAQIRLYAEAKALTGLTGLGVQPVTLPLYVEAASAQAKISTMSCPLTTSDQSAQISVSPSIGSLAIGQVDTTKLNDFKHGMTIDPAVIVSIPLVQITGQANVTLGGAQWQTVNFSHGDITGGVIKTVSTTDLTQATAASLAKNVNLQVKVLGLGLNTNGLTTPVANELGVIAPLLDQQINALTDLLGVKLGQADVRVNGLRCRDAALVG